MLREKHYIVEINSEQVTPEVTALFNPADPASLRCFAVLEGQAAGRIFTNHPEKPSWVVVQEGAFGSLYLGGTIHFPLLHRLIASRRREGDVLVGLDKDDPRWALFPPIADYSGWTLEFTNREGDGELPPIPTGYRLQVLDATLFKEILGRNLFIRMFGTIQNALKFGHGLCLMHGDEILCETFAGPGSKNVVEIGVETHPHHMRKGYGFLTCSHLIHAMETQGYRTYWNCDKTNLPSVALARKLGYRTEKEYRLMAWFKQAI